MINTALSWVQVNTSRETPSLVLLRHLALAENLVSSGQNRQLLALEGIRMTADKVLHQTEKTFFSQTDFNQILGAFDILERTLVWVKDIDSRIMFANSFFIYQYGASSLDQLIGKNDYDFLPPDMARKFIADDKKVLSGVPVRERLELNIQRSGEIAWFETSKYPLKSTDGKVIGTYGLSRRRDKVSIPLAAVQQLEVSLDYIRTNYASDIEISELARVSFVSISTLERRFRKYLNRSPKQFINEIRLEQGRRLLRDTNEPIASIAASIGFPDPSYFARLYSRWYGCSPTDFRHQLANR